MFVDLFPTALDIYSGTATNSVNVFPPSTEIIGEIRDASRYPYKYPYFLYPHTHKIPLALASHRPATDAQNFLTFNRTSMHSSNKHRHENATNLFNVNGTSNHIGWMHLQRELRKQFYDVGENDFDAL